MDKVRTYALYPDNTRGWWFSRIADKDTRIEAFQGFYEHPNHPDESLLSHCRSFEDALAGFIWAKHGGFRKWADVLHKNDLLAIPYYEIDQKFQPNVKQGDQFTIGDKSKVTANFVTDYCRSYEVGSIEYYLNSWTIHVPGEGWIQSIHPMPKCIKLHDLTSKKPIMEVFSMYDKVYNKHSGIPYIYAGVSPAGDDWCYVELLQDAPGSVKEEFAVLPASYKLQGTGTFKEIRKKSLTHANPGVSERSDEALHGEDYPFKPEGEGDVFKSDGAENIKRDELPCSIEEATKRGYWPGAKIRSILDNNMEYVLTSFPHVYDKSLMSSIDRSNTQSVWLWKDNKWAYIVERGPLSTQLLEYLGYRPGVFFRSALSGKLYQYKGNLVIDQRSQTVVVDTTDIDEYCREASNVTAHLYYKGTWAKIEDKIPAGTPEARTILWWLIQIPNQYVKNLAIGYLYDESTKSCSATQKVLGMSSALQNAFNFRLTSEGYDYWAGIVKLYGDYQPDCENLNSKENGTSRKEPERLQGKILKVDRPDADITRGPEVRGDSVQGAATPATITGRPLGYTERS